MRQLPPSKQHHSTRHVPGTEHARLSRPRSRVYLLLQDRPEEGVPPGTDERRQHPEDGHHDAVRTVQVHPHDLWHAQRGQHIPTAD